MRILKPVNSFHFFLRGDVLAFFNHFQPVLIHLGGLDQLELVLGFGLVWLFHFHIEWTANLADKASLKWRSNAERTSTSSITAFLVLIILLVVDRRLLKGCTHLVDDLHARVSLSESEDLGTVLRVSVRLEFLWPWRSNWATADFFVHF